MVNEFDCAEDRRSECNGLPSAADVCNWERPEEGSDLWKTSCGDIWLIVEGKAPEDAALIFCPMCGRKVVGA